jgi:hypothetical protein
MVRPKDWPMEITTEKRRQKEIAKDFLKDWRLATCLATATEMR